MPSGRWRLGTGLMALGLLAALAAQAEWQQDRGDWHGHEQRHWRGGDEYHGGDGGDAIAGAVIGLGLGALLGGMIAAQPQYQSAPPPVVAAPPGYYPAPGYGYPAPPGYY